MLQCLLARLCSSPPGTIIESRVDCAIREWLAFGADEAMRQWSSECSHWTGVGQNWVNWQAELDGDLHIQSHFGTSHFHNWMRDASMMIALLKMHAEQQQQKHAYKRNGIKQSQTTFFWQTTPKGKWSSLLHLGISLWKFFVLTYKNQDVIKFKSRLFNRNIFLIVRLDFQLNHGQDFAWFGVLSLGDS